MENAIASFHTMSDLIVDGEPIEVPAIGRELQMIAHDS
jgi:hypothetical protein